MAIKDLEDKDTVSIYDAGVGAYREIPVSRFRLQLKSLGLTDEEIEEKVKKVKGGK